MTLVAPRRFGIAAFVLGFVPALALAQTAPAPRAWTDPPAREATPTAEAPRPAEKTPRAATVKAATVKAAPAPRTVARSTRAARTASAHPAPRPKVSAHPMAARRVAATSPRLRGPGRDPAVRVVTMRAAPYAGPPVRYGYVVEAAPARPMSDGSMSYEDMRAARIRRAEEAGYIVVRSRSVEFPDGRRLRTYRPLDEDADD